MLNFNVSNIGKSDIRLKKKNTCNEQTGSNNYYQNKTKNIII